MEELSRECLMETLDVFSGLKRIGGSEDEHRACGYLIKKLQEWRSGDRRSGRWNSSGNSI